MNQTIKLDTRKRECKHIEARIAPLRRGERNNALLTVKVCENGQTYDLTGKTASLVATTAAGKLVGPCQMQVAEAGIARIMLPAALYSAVGAFSGYVEIREGETLVDTTDSFGGKVIECADLDAEQAEEFTSLLGELQNAVAEEAKRVEAEKARAQAETERETGFAEAKQASQAATEAANDAAEGANLAAISASTAAESANTAAGKAKDAAAKAESDVMAFVNAAGTAVGDAISGAREDVDAAVKRSDAATAKAEEATKTADAANTAATEAAADAQAAIADVKATEAQLYPVAENTLKGKTNDTFIHVDDAFPSTLLGIEIEGACRQDGTPSPDSPVPIEVVENPVVRVTGRNLANPSEAYYYATGMKKPEKIPDGFRFVITNNGNRIINIPCKLKKGYKFAIDFDEKQLSGTTQRIQIYIYKYNMYMDKRKQYVAPGDIEYIGIYITDGTVGEYEITNFRVTRNVDDGYKPYTSQSLAFTLPSEHPYLAKLPDGTADEIVIDKDGNVELVARVSKVIPKDSDSIDFGAGTDTNVPYVSFHVSGIANKMGILCNSYKTSHWVNESGYIYCPNDLDIAIRDSRFTSKEKAIELLNSVVVYLAVEPTRYPLGKIEIPKAQDSIINVWTDAEVTPNTSIEYLRDMNIVVENLESAIASIS